MLWSFIWAEENTITQAGKQVVVSKPNWMLLGRFFFLILDLACSLTFADKQILNLLFRWKKLDFQDLHRLELSDRAFNATAPFISRRINDASFKS